MTAELSSTFLRPPISVDQAYSIAEQIVTGGEIQDDVFEYLRVSWRRYALTLQQRAEYVGGVSIYGAGTIGRQALTSARTAGLIVKQFLDKRASSAWSGREGVAVNSPDTAAANDVVLIAVGRGVADIRRSLASVGSDVIGLTRFTYCMDVLCGSAEQHFIDLQYNTFAYKALFRELSDEVSRQTLLAILVSRISLDDSVLECLVSQNAPQWFEGPFFEKNSQHVFIDGGAFDGDTVAGFVDANGPEFHAVIAFEPDERLASAAKARFLSDSRITVVNAALGRHPDIGFFTSTGATDGHLIRVESPGHRVTITSIDSLGVQGVTFIKLDVEGNEAETLSGAVKTLRQHRPRLAVAAYHRPADLHSIPALISQLMPDSRFYLRHYTDTSFESVIYVLPNT